MKGSFASEKDRISTLYCEVVVKE